MTKTSQPVKSWSTHRDTLFNRLPSWGPGPKTLISSVSGSVVIYNSRLNAFEGEGNAQPYAVLGLCMAGGGRTQKENDLVRLDDVWRPGRVGLALPGPAAQGFTPSMDMLAIAFDLDDVPACHGKKLDIDDLRMAASQLFDDELVSAVLIALLRDAEAHGTSSAFFDHGLSLILHRLATRTNIITRSLTNTFKRCQLANVTEVIESRLDEDLRVKELAEIQGLGTRTFTRMFKQEMGSTPYKYLTMRRMERAKLLLKSNTSVTSTASAVGYANPAKFAAAFRRWVGTSPSEWKNSGQR